MSWQRFGPLAGTCGLVIRMAAEATMALPLVKRQSRLAIHRYFDRRGDGGRWTAMGVVDVIIWPKEMPALGVRTCGLRKLGTDASSRAR